MVQVSEEERGRERDKEKIVNGMEGEMLKV
jgi:hypothetical protein